MRLKKNIIRDIVTSAFILIPGIFFLLLIDIVIFNKEANGLFLQNSKDRQVYIISVIALVLYLISFIIVKIRYYKGKMKGLILFVLSLGVVSGITFMLMTYIMNRIMESSIEVNANLVGLFTTTLFIYAYTVKVVRKEITTVTNEFMCNKRTTLLKSVANCSFEKFETIGSEKIFTCINNDIENISSLISIAVSGLTSSIVMVCCCVYLTIFNIKLFLIAFAVIALVFGIIIAVSYLNGKRWGIARDEQDTFYGYLDGLLKGFADLVIKNKKLNQYMDDILASNRKYTNSRIKAEVSFSYVAFATEALIFLFLGFTVIMLPLISNQFTLRDVRQFFVVFMMLKGHFDVVVNAVQQVPKILTSNSRIKIMLKEFGAYDDAHKKKKPELMLDAPLEQIVYQDIEYEYKDRNEEGFKIGPLNLTLKKGQITFIIGGNGSGKSTLGKVITGLYQPDRGKILINSNDAGNYRISELFSTIYFDTYLFQKLYGIDENSIQGKTDFILKQMQLDQKVKIENGKISDIRLSTGQKKRVALVVSYLDNSPIYFFDEWAAEQDPEFKNFFYTSLLPMLKKEDKCVIAITHDDRFFYLADQIIKIDEGKVIELKER